MNKFSNANEPEENEEEINLREILDKYIHRWKWFAISIFTFLFIGVFVYLNLDRKYSITSSVLLREDKAGGSASSNSPLGSLQELGLLSSTNNIDNEVAVFSSPNLMRQVVLTLEIQTTYFEKGIFRDTEVYNKCPYYARLENIKADELNGNIEMDIVPNGKDGISIKGVYKVLKEEYEFDTELNKLPGFIDMPQNLGKLYITYRPNATEEKKKEKYKIYIQNAQRVAYSLAKDIKVSPTTKTSSVLNLGLNVLDVSKGIDILNVLTKTYNSNNVEDNNEIAINTSRFVDARLTDIAKELGDVESQVVAFKEEQKITDVGTEAKIYLEQTSSIQEKRTSLETQLKTIEMVENFITNRENYYKVIPSLSITDPGLAEMIMAYNTLLLSYERLDKSTSADNPSRIRAQAELDNTRNNILISVANVKKAMLLSKQEIDKQIGQLSARVYSVPTQEKGLLEIMRQQQVKQALYLYLMQVKEETNVTMASTSNKAKVITDPIIPEYPISPNRNIILLASLLLGLVIPVGIIYIKDLLEVSITSREELEKRAKPSVIGEIIKKDEPQTLVVKQNKVSPIVELFRALRNNLQFILDSPDKKVVLVTSTIPGEGKTFVSINLAASFSITDKKVLLIGMDIRNPKLPEDMNFKKGVGLTSYLSGSEPNWKDLLIKIDEYPRLDILQAGAIPPNPNELLMKPSLRKLMSEARQEYDMIVIDSAPVGVISDTLLLADISDVTVYVTREHATPKNAVSYINDLYQNNKLPNIYLVLNGVNLAKSKGRYGYGKTYGYGANHHKN